jgi:asparagine synthase (glutamine-hydrolysing)
MCGICGVVGLKEPGLAETTVRAMIRAMVHRGPDDEGVWVGESLALGMRRLSIIDLAGGHQPVFNESGTLAVVFNGEIYNFQDLRRSLKARGHIFRSGSDTETIVHAYEEWGTDCVNHLEGMFAFALAETPERAEPGKARVFLARDRFGIKPCYYALASGALVFASEVRALLATGKVPARLSLAGLRSYLLFGSVGEPSTLVEGVFSLPPGHRMMVSLNDRGLTAAPEPYWDFGTEALRPAEIPPGTDRSLTAGLRSVLEASTERHLIADVPLGIFLSSGIDSTALVALAAGSAKARQGAGVHTLTVIFPEQEYSEAEQARRTAKQFGTKHQEVLLRGEDMLARLDEAVAALDQPSMDGINTYFVSWAARQAGLKVALSGLGGDEIFGGYSTFRQAPHAARLAGLGRRVPARLRSLMAAAVDKAAGRNGPGDARRKLLALWRHPDALPHPYFYTRLLFTPEQVSQLLQEPATSCVSQGRPADAWKAWLSESASQAEQLDGFTAVSCLEARSYMANTLLRDTDAMSMAQSLEVRVPFLDHRLIELVARLPQSVKRNGHTPKALLVHALADLLPPEVVRQRKRTFTLPWEYWLRESLRDRVAAEMSGIAASLEQVLEAGAVWRTWSDFLQGRTRWSRVWSLFVLNRWARQHLRPN